MLEKNMPFPDFALPDQDGVTHDLKQYIGKWLVVYFYPKDNSSACTLEAQDFTSLAGHFEEKNASIIGVSPDSVKSHAGFAVKKDLRVTLLSDPEHALLTAAGVWQKKKLYGKEHMGVVRTTALVGPDGILREVWSRVKTPGHAEEVLARLDELQKG